MMLSLSSCDRVAAETSLAMVVVVARFLCFPCVMLVACHDAIDSQLPIRQS